MVSKRHAFDVRAPGKSILQDGSGSGETKIGLCLSGQGFSGIWDAVHECFCSDQRISRIACSSHTIRPGPSRQPSTKIATTRLSDAALSGPNTGVF